METINLDTHLARKPQPEDNENPNNNKTQSKISEETYVENSPRLFIIFVTATIFSV